MNLCRCTHSVYRHYADDEGGNCTACPCPEYRPASTIDTQTAVINDQDLDYRLRNMVG